MNSLLTDSLLLPHSESFSDGDIEHAPRVPTHSSEFGMKGFFEEVQEIDKQIEKLSKLLTRLQDAHEESKAVTKASAMKEIKHRMGKDIDEVLKIARITKKKLEELNKDNLANRQKTGCDKGSAVDRSRTATTISLKKMLKERLTDFQSLRETINQEYREVVERRVFTVTGNRPDEETIDRLIETGNDEQIFEKAIQEQGRSEVTATLAEIQERHDAMRDLERKLLELQQIFFDMAVLVASQGDILDNVESQVSTALDHIHSGTSALQKVKWVQKNSSKWICLAVIILVIIVVVIVVGVLKPWNRSS